MERTYGSVFVFECRGEHVREKLEGDREQQFHERHNDKDCKGNETQYVLRCAFQLIPGQHGVAK